MKPESMLRKDQRTAGTATFQHRHFATIAAVIAAMEPNTAAYGEARAWALKWCEELRHTNSYFDAQRFLAACGV